MTGQGTHEHDTDTDTDTDVGTDTDTDAATVTDVETAVQTALGQELRRIRVSAGWTRQQLTDSLPVSLHAQTLSGYERGTVKVTAARLALLCRQLGVSTGDVMAAALQRIQFDVPTAGVRVDLRELIRNTSPELRPLRRWARNRLKLDPDASGIAWLPWPAVCTLADACGFDRDRLVAALTDFLPALGGRAAPAPWQTADVDTDRPTTERI